MAKKPEQKGSSPSKNRTTPGSKKPAPLRQGFFARNTFPILLFLLAFVVFGNGIFNEYALDDEFYTNGANKTTQMGVKGIPKILKSRTFFNNDGSGYSYRPVTLISFALEIQAFGEKPHVSHFINVLLYAFTLVLLFGLLRRWFVQQGDWFAFFVCLIFLVHPLHTEPVDNIKCRDELLSFFFIVLSMISLWNYLDTKKIIYIVLYPLCFLLAMFAKETAQPFIVLIPLALWFFTDLNWKKIVLFGVLLLAMLLLRSMLQQYLLPAPARTFQDFENPLPGKKDFGVHTATSMYILGWYLWLHIIPHPLVYYYGYAYVPLVSWSNPIAILSLLVYIALGLIALRGFKSKSVLSFGLLFFLGSAAAYSNLFRPAPGLMAERFMYSTSLGFCIVLVWLLFRLTKTDPAAFRWKNADQKLIRFILLSIAFLFTLRSWVRNEDWEDKLTLYSHDIEYTHESAKANMLLASLQSKNAMEARLMARDLMQRGDKAGFQQKYLEAQTLFEDARTHFRKAGEIAPYYHTAWSNLGTTFFFLERPGDSSQAMTDSALVYFLKSIRIKPNYSEGLFNVAMAYERLGHTDSAIYYFRKSIASDSGYVNSYDQLSRIMVEKQNNPKGALDLLRIASKKKPDSEAPWNAIAKVYLQTGDTAAAAGATEMAAEINPANTQRLYNLSMYYRAHGDFIKGNYWKGRLDEQVRIQREQHPEMFQQQPMQQQR